MSASGSLCEPIVRLSPPEQWADREAQPGLFSTLLHFSEEYKGMADLRGSPTPVYLQEQRVWLSTKDLPLCKESRKLSPRFIGPFPVSKVIDHSALRLKLPRSSWVHPMFHVSWVKPVWESALVPATRSRPPPQLIDGDTSYTMKRLHRGLVSRERAAVFGGLGRLWAMRSNLGSLLGTFWTLSSSRTSMLRFLGLRVLALGGYCQGPLVVECLLLGSM